MELVAERIQHAAEFLRDLVAREVIRLEHVSGTVMLADLLTKAVNRMLYLALVQLLVEYSARGVVTHSYYSVPSRDTRSGGAVPDH